ncbi:MAG: ribokinase [Candidatus Azotimanducaceae bacterium]
MVIFSGAFRKNSVISLQVQNKEKSTATPRIVVVGSTNWDICLYLPELPTPGETVGGGRMKTAIGGKGANQAIASHRAGAAVRFVSCVGDDESATSILSAFREYGLDTAAVSSVEDCNTGTACIFIDARGENCIGITPGANDRLDVAALKNSAQLIADADVLLLQLETPVEGVQWAARQAQKSGTQVVLNPAPVQPMSSEMYECVDVLTPNRGELARLTGIETDTDAGLKNACIELTQRGVGSVLVTLGEEGAFLHGALGEARFGAFEVQAVDTTAAGDVFNGYFAAGYGQFVKNGSASDQVAVEAIIRRAMAAAAIAVTKEGAMPSIPMKDEVEKLLRSERE